MDPEHRHRRRLTRALAPLLVGALVVLAGCLGAAQPTTTPPQQEATVSVTATGSAVGTPDQALVHLSVVGQAATADEARNAAAADAERMRSALRDAGIADDRVRTTGFVLHPEYDYRQEGRELLGYRAVHTYQIELDDVTRAGEVVDTAVENGADTVDSVQFTLSDERRQEVRGEALARAVENGRADAETIATAGDVTLGGLVSASTGDVSYGPMPYYAESAARDDAGTVLEPGDVTITATVTAVYELA
ncbi:SIMPL domain-containing protein [Halomarina litorea]|uniref:SIMPL domain-containing protein n=1 Tax=Halomarina litorea TaxID=2961595 RepID=UPI0020C226AF|nr:SIMPL domain-containing protein [Halomarina sp. BCD28]